jgi:cellulase/cellobiase CelA1
MTVTNLGHAKIAGWTLRFRLAGGQSVDAGWNGDWSQHGSAVTVRNTWFDRSVPPGGTVTLGFVGPLRSGSANAPANFSLNGASCNG